jgi:nucleolar protein 58
MLYAQVNEQIILAASTLLDCEVIEKNHFEALKEAGEIIKDVSGINTTGWTLLKIATALMIIFYPEKSIVAGNPKEVNGDVL